MKNSIFKKVKNLSLEIVDLIDIAPKSETISYLKFINTLKNIQKSESEENLSNILLIDVRSEFEYLEHHIPYSINIALLNNEERSDVGIFYKVDQQKAVSYAYYLAKDHEQNLIKQVEKYLLGDRSSEIIIYCHRGGGRSRYFAKMLKNYGFSNIRYLDGGYKGFRKKMYNLLYSDIPTPIISLSGLTGCGKSEILEYIENNKIAIPIIHLEKCACHASSVFGHIRFGEKNSKTVNQIIFETNIFMYMLPYLNYDQSKEQFIFPLPFFLSEKESRKIGGVLIPPAVFMVLKEERHIIVSAPMSNRVKRLREDYFFDLQAIEGVKKALLYLTKRLGVDKIDHYVKLIDEGNYDLFLEDILLMYYDKVYSKTESIAIAQIKHLSLDDTIERIRKEFFHFKYYQS